MFFTQWPWPLPPVTPKSIGFLCYPGWMCGLNLSKIGKGVLELLIANEKITDGQTRQMTNRHVQSNMLSLLRRGGIINSPLCLRDNSVHFHEYECSPFWVGISTICMIIVKMFEIGLTFNVKDNNILPCLHNIRLPITYRNASVLCQSECACLHKTVNMVVFFVKSNEHIYLKGRALMLSL